MNFKDCTGPPSNSFLPPTREVRAVVEGAWTLGGPQTTYANGIIAGQYHAPMADYRFPENLPGKPVVENNFNSIDFLAKGGYTSSAGTYRRGTQSVAQQRSADPAMHNPASRRHRRPIHHILRWIDYAERQRQYF